MNQTHYFKNNKFEYSFIKSSMGSVFSGFPTLCDFDTYHSRNDQQHLGPESAYAQNDKPTIGPGVF